jgi:hypothetical protein
MMGRIMLNLLIVGFFAAVAYGSVRRSEGEPLFEFAVSFEQPPQVGQLVKLRLMVLDFSDDADDSITVTARIELPPSWILVEGDANRKMRSNAREFAWTVTVRPTQTGRFQLRRFVQIDRASSLDEGDYMLPVELRTDSTIIGASKQLRLETVRSGQRFRYADAFLVPIDGPEDFTQSDLRERARVVSGRVAECGACTASDAATVTWVVFLDETGHVKTARLASNIEAGSAAAVATRAAINSWSFAPGRVKSRGVSDWVIVHVSVAR